MKKMAVSLTVTLALLVSAVGAGAALITLPAAGSASQVSALVAGSTSITSLPSNLNPSLPLVPTDSVDNTSLHVSVLGCPTIEKLCEYGDKTATRTVVLFGDSHAEMWLAAVNPGLVKAHYRLYLLYRAGCPVANITYYGTYTNANSYDTGCASWRTRTIAAIKKMAPKLVLLAERTAGTYYGPSQLVTATKLTPALEVTIKALKSTKTKVAIIGDIPIVENNVSPPACLSLNPANIQNCTIPQVNPQQKWRSWPDAEHAAAKATGITFIDTGPWLCTAGKCSMVIGNMPSYFDPSHISATYSAYLATVMYQSFSRLL